jgi:diguanylate cyclase (GGDEF)-like protein
MSFDALKDLLALLQLTEQLTDGRALEDALRAVTDTTLAILPGDHASIRLLDANRTHLLSGARSGIGLDTPSVELRVGAGVSGWALQHGEPVRIVDAKKDGRFMNVGGQGFAIGSMVVEPLISEGVPIGVLSVSSPDVNAFSVTDELLARLLANCSVGPIQRARLELLAVTDDLTLAFNGRYLGSRLAEEMERARRTEKPLSVLLMDLDHFKLVNDKHGHGVGDQVLRTFVDRVRSATRRVDVLVRRGGEEFVLLMPATTIDQATFIAERVRKHASDHPVLVGTAKITQTVSIGVATWDGRESSEALQRRSDEAMYYAKQLGRNRVERSEVRPARAAKLAAATASKPAGGARKKARETARETVTGPVAKTHGAGKVASGSRAAAKSARKTAGSPRIAHRKRSARS